MNLFSPLSALIRPWDRAARFRLSAQGARLTRSLGIVLALSETTSAISANRFKMAQADAAASSTPLPPERPTMLAPPVSPAPVAPQPNEKPVETTAVPPPQKEPDEPIDNSRFNDGPGTMLKLPPASHARMHQCAMEWQNMKFAGAAAEKIWFNFARKCLTR
jgi:hypothetical protein